MATRGKTTFQKRQKEMARKEKRQRKEARREERKLSRDVDVEDRVPPQDEAESSEPEDDRGRQLTRNETIGPSVEGPERGT